MVACETLQTTKISSCTRARRIVFCTPCLPTALLQLKMKFFGIQNSIASSFSKERRKGTFRDKRRA